MMRLFVAIGLLASLAFAGQSRSDDLSTVYILMAGGQKRLALYVDDALTAKLRRDEFLKVALTPGNHTFKFKGQNAWNFPTAGGQTYYFEVVRLQGAELRFTVVSRQQAETDMARMISVPLLHGHE